MKWLHEFAVNDEKETEQIESSIDTQGNEVKTTKKVKKIVPVKFKIQKPTRKLFDEAELFYGIKLSEGIKAGLLTKALLAKRYQNDGGAMSEPEKEKYTQLYVDLYSKETEFQKVSLNLENISPEDKTAKVAKLLGELTEIRSQLQTLEFSQIALFDQTAENRARNKTILWWILNLSYMIDKENKEACLFGEGTHEERLAIYDAFEDGTDEWLKTVVKKFAFYISFWYMGRASTQEEFEKLVTFENV
jgi:superfamily II DNA or RNA helicase